jgi:hypothetical protein
MRTISVRSIQASTVSQWYEWSMFNPYPVETADNPDRFMAASAFSQWQSPLLSNPHLMAVVYNHRRSIRLPVAP